MLLICPKSSTTPKPFLKWAGGKTQLIKQISNFFPKELIHGSIRKYVEPFIGGGAILFDLAYKYQIQELFIFDINPELFIAYKTIQQNVDDVINLLSKIERSYLNLSNTDRDKFFYDVRKEFNYNQQKTDYNNYNPNWIERTCQIIFLNKTCYNGLYRVNSKGEFNVPTGRYKKPTICDSENLIAVAEVLQNTKIYQGDFSKCEHVVDSNTLVYFDPPYRPVSETSCFTSYSQQSFGDSEQLRLRNFFVELDKKGGFLILSNSDPKNENSQDNFFENAYADFRIERVKASRLINSNASKRNQINELLIMNY